MTNNNNFTKLEIILFLQNDNIIVINMVAIIIVIIVFLFIIINTFVTNAVQYYCFRSQGKSNMFCSIVSFISAGLMRKQTREARHRCFGHAWRKYDGYQEKDAEDGTARKEETGKDQKKIYGCGERGHGKWAK